MTMTSLSRCHRTTWSPTASPLLTMYFTQLSLPEHVFLTVDNARSSSTPRASVSGSTAAMTVTMAVASPPMQAVGVATCSTATATTTTSFAHHVEDIMRPREYTSCRKDSAHLMINWSRDLPSASATGQPAQPPSPTTTTNYDEAPQTPVRRRGGTEDDDDSPIVRTCRRLSKILSSTTEHMVDILKTPVSRWHSNNQTPSSQQIKKMDYQRTVDVNKRPWDVQPILPKRKVSPVKPLSNDDSNSKEGHVDFLRITLIGGDFNHHQKNNQNIKSSEDKNSSDEDLKPAKYSAKAA